MRNCNWSQGVWGIGEREEFQFRLLRCLADARMLIEGLTRFVEQARRKPSLVTQMMYQKGRHLRSRERCTSPQTCQDGSSYSSPNAGAGSSAVHLPALSAKSGQPTQECESETVSSGILGSRTGAIPWYRTSTSLLATAISSTDCWLADFRWRRYRLCRCLKEKIGHAIQSA